MQPTTSTLAPMHVHIFITSILTVKLKFQALVSTMIGHEVMEQASQVLVCKRVDVHLTMLIGPPYLVQHIHESNGVIALLTHGAEEMV